MRRGWMITWLATAAVAGFLVGRAMPFGVGLNPESATAAASLVPASGSVVPLPASLENSVLAEEWDWFSRIRDADAETIAAVVGETGSIGDRGMREQMRRLAFERWLELDPEAALKWASPRQRTSYFDSLFAEWAARDREGAIAAADTLDDEKTRQRAYHQICKVMAAGDDPEGFLSWANELDQKLVPQNLYKVSITKLAQEDLGTARRIAESIRGNPANMNSLRHVAEVWADSDPEAAMAWAKTFKNSDFTDQAMALILPKIAASDPERAGREFQNLKNPRMKRAPIVREIVRNLTQSDPELGVEWLGNHVGESDRWEHYDHIAAVALEDSPAAALKAMEAISGSLPDNPSFAESWQPDLGNKEMDPAKFLVALDGLPGTEVERSQLRRGLVEVFGRQDFEKAWAYASAFPDLREREGLIRLAFKDPSDKTAAWNASETLPVSTVRAEVQNKLIRDIATENLDLALSRFAGLPPDQQNGAVASDLIYRLGWQSIRKATEFAESLAPGPAKDSAWSQVIDSWADQDPIGLSEWADGLEPGSRRDEAAQILSQSLGSEDPEAAFAWAASINHEAERTNRIGLVIREWRKNDPAQAEAALLRSTSISDTERKELLQLIRRQ